MKLNVTKEWCERMARLEGDAAIGAGMQFQLMPRRLHSHWAAYPDYEEVFFNVAQAIVEAHTFPAATLHAAHRAAQDTGRQEATTWLLVHGRAGNKFPDCSANLYFSNLEKSAQLMSGSAGNKLLAFALRAAIVQIAEAYRTGWNARFAEKAT